MPILGVGAAVMLHENKLLMDGLGIDDQNPVEWFGKKTNIGKYCCVTNIFDKHNVKSSQVSPGTENGAHYYDCVCV